MVVLASVTVSLVVAVVNNNVSTPTPRSIELPVMAEHWASTRHHDAVRAAAGIDRVAHR